MGDVIIGSISRFSEIIKGLKDQINEIDQIKKLMKSHLPTFIKALNRINTSLEMLTYVFQGTPAHNELFKHKLLSFSQIETIVVKLEPMHTLLTLLRTLNCTDKFVDRMRLYWQLYTNYERPSLIHAQLKRYFKIIENALPVIIELNSTIFGSAMRIKQPILRKAWMLVGDNQLNDSSLPVNIIQDNLYMLLKLELDERTINSLHKKKDKYKIVINQIVTDIDNRGASDGDGNISLAELNDLPDEVMENIHSGDHDDHDDHNYQDDDDDDDDVCEVDYRRKPSSVNRLKKFEDACNWICAMMSGTSGNVCSEEIEEIPVPIKYVTQAQKNHYIVRATDFFDRYRSYLRKMEKQTKVKSAISVIAKSKSESVLQTSSGSDKDSDGQAEQPDFVGSDVEYEGLAAFFNDNVQVAVPIPLYENPKIDGTSERNVPPKSTGDYGHNFISKKIASLDIKRPSEFSDKLCDDINILTTVTFTMIANDQGWGGSNSAHVRYQINDGNCIKAFTITRRPKEHLHAEYTFTINGCELNKNSDKSAQQTVYIWLYCPPWPGWEAEVHKISCDLKYN